MSESRFAALAVVSLAIPLFALADARPSDAAPSCVVREVARREIRTESGNKIFVEPLAFVSDGKANILLAGPVALFIVGPDGENTALQKNTIFGVVVDSRLQQRPVPNPMQGEFVGVRAAARTSGGWHVVFGDTASSPRPATAVGTWSAATDALWYGVFSGQSWTTLERLPIPPGVIVGQQFASRLAARGDSLAWAVPMRTQRGERHLLLYERRNGTWSYEEISTRNAGAQVAYSDRLGVVLAVVQADTTLREDANSLIIRTREGGWRPLRRLVHGRLEGTVLNPSLTFVGDTMVVGWYGSASGPRGLRKLQARAIVRALRDPDTAKIVLDSSVLGEPQALVPAMQKRGVRIWLTRHVSPAGDASELRFVQDSGGVVRVLQSVPDPFYFNVSAVSIDSSRIVVSGMKYIPGKIFISLLLQFQVDCRSRN